MERIKITDDERLQVSAHHEAAGALVSLVNMSVSNMDREVLEACLDETLPLLKEAMLSSWDTLSSLKKKYGLTDVWYCPSDGEVYGRV